MTILPAEFRMVLPFTVPNPLLINFRLDGVDRAAQGSDRTVTMTVEVDDYMRDPRFSSYVEYQRHLAIQETARNQHAKRKGRAKLKPHVAWRIEATRARRMVLEAVKLANSISPPTGGWRREREAARPYFSAASKAVRLLCAATCAWAKARILAHMAGDDAGVAYCTRGLHAAQAAPRPPTWVQDVGEPPTIAAPPIIAGPPMDALAPIHTPPSFAPTHRHG